MQTHIPNNCGNSPRSLPSIEIAISLAANKYDKLKPLLAEDFTFRIAGDDKKIAKSEVQAYMEGAGQSKISIDRLDILTSISHGKYAAVSSRAYTSDGGIQDSHDLYEFTGAGGSAKLRKVTSYIANSRVVVTPCLPKKEKLNTKIFSV